MANEPIFDVASFDFKGKLCSAQTVVDSRLLPMGGVKISKVLSYSAGSFVEVSEVFTGEARVSGRVIFRVVFLDSEGETRTMETSTDFTDKVNSDAIKGGRPEVLDRILDINILSVDGDEIKLAAIVEMDFFDNITSRLKYLSSGGDEIFSTDEKIEGLRLVCTVQDTLSISDESAASGDKILLSESVVIAHDTVAEMSSVAVSGEIITNLITDSAGEIHNYRIVTPFAHQMGADGCNPSCYAEINVRLASSNVTLLKDEESGQSAVAMEYSLAFATYCYAFESISPVLDAFSITNELSLTTDQLPVTVSRAQKRVSEKVEGSVSLSGDMPLADKILAAAGSKVNITNAFVDESERLVLEGAVSSSVIYFSAETGSKNSVDIELPFSIVTSESGFGKVLYAYGEVEELVGKIRRGSEIDVKAEIVARVCFADTREVRVVTDISVGAAVEIPSSALSLHIVRGNESLWDVAKALKTTPELILMQNPALELPLTGGERVIVYRHLKK